MLTKEEKEKLEIERASAKSRMAETYKTILHIRKILTCYGDDWLKWQKRFEKADRALAEEEKVKVVTKSKDKADVLSIDLTPQQVLDIAEALGVEVDSE